MIEPNMEENKNTLWPNADFKQDRELMELLFFNGQVVMQSQVHRKPPSPLSPSPISFPPALLPPPTPAEELAPWYPYSLDDPLGKDLLTELFDDNAPLTDPTAATRYTPTMPPLPPQSLEMDSHSENDCTLPAQARSESVHSSTVTTGLSLSGGRAVPAASAVAANIPGGVLDSGLLTRTVKRCPPEATDASSSGKPAAGDRGSGKRKERDTTNESDGHCEDDEFEELAEGRRQPTRAPPAGRRSRAAEVHNISERRRRDRINEKMKALQELIPHCNKTDKASMLDEAIEYLKSLQLQVQMMWLGGGGGVAPMMFPAGFANPYAAPNLGLRFMHPLTMYPAPSGLTSAAGGSSAQMMNQLQLLPQTLGFCPFGNQVPTAGLAGAGEGVNARLSGMASSALASESARKNISG